MNDDVKELQDLAKYYQNQANYYHEKATKWHKQADQDDAEQSRLIGLMNKIYVLTDSNPRDNKRGINMTKALIYDTDKQEYVTAVNRRLVSGDIDYLTSKDVEEAQVVDADDLNLRDIEHMVGLKRGILVFRDVPEDTL